jgi:hypothetical protein
MQGATWTDLIQRIPPEHHDHLIVVTSNGTELAIQGVVRIEEEYMVVRGRMAGTDVSRMLFIPYGNILYLGFHRQVKESEIRAMYGSPIRSRLPRPTLNPPERSRTRPPKRRPLSRHRLPRSRAKVCPLKN